MKINESSDSGRMFVLCLCSQELKEVPKSKRGNWGALVWAPNHNVFLCTYFLRNVRRNPSLRFKFSFHSPASIRLPLPTADFWAPCKIQSVVLCSSQFTHYFLVLSFTSKSAPSLSHRICQNFRVPQWLPFWTLGQFSNWSPVCSPECSSVNTPMTLKQDLSFSLKLPTPMTLLLFGWHQHSKLLSLGDAESTL